MRCEWQVEIDPYCQRVLAKHWPTVRRWDDVRTFPPSPAESWKVDVICGGFPCQDISTANPKRTGVTGARSGMWSEFIRVVRELGPRVFVVENVSNLAVLGLDQVLGDIADSGFDAEWATIPASRFGAPQSRRRMLIIAYSSSERWPVVLRDDTIARAEAAPWGEWQAHSPATPCHVLQAVEQSLGESSVLGSGNGILAAVDRLRVTGNSVVPQLSQWIGARIIKTMKGQ